MKRNNKKGFTIVELVIVIAVIAILAAVLIPTFSGIVTKAKENAALQEAKNEYTNIYALALSDNGIIDADDDFDADGDRVKTEDSNGITTAYNSTAEEYTITTTKYVFTFTDAGILDEVTDKLGDSGNAKFTYEVVDGVIKSATTIK